MHMLRLIGSLLVICCEFVFLSMFLAVWRGFGFSEWTGLAMTVISLVVINFLFFSPVIVVLHARRNQKLPAPEDSADLMEQTTEPSMLHLQQKDPTCGDHLLLLLFLLLFVIGTFLCFYCITFDIAEFLPSPFFVIPARIGAIVIGLVGIFLSVGACYSLVSGVSDSIKKTQNDSAQTPRD